MPFGIGTKGGPFKIVTAPYGAISKLMELPCAIPPVVLVEAAVEATLWMFATVEGPDYRHVYHKLLGNSALCHVKGVVNEALGAGGVEGGALKRNLFKVAEKIDYATFVYFIADVFASGLVNWASMARRMAPCNSKGSPNNGTGSEWIGAIPDNGDWRTMDFSFNTGSRFAPVSPSEMVLNKGDTAIMAGHVSFAPWLSDVIVPTGARIRNQTTGDVYDIDTPKPNTDGSGKSTLVFAKIQHLHPDRHTYAVEWSNTSGLTYPLHELFPVTDTMWCFMAYLPFIATDNPPPPP